MAVMPTQKQLDEIAGHPDAFGKAFADMEAPPERGASEPYVTALLKKHASIFEQRNAVYGDNYRMVGRIMVAMFPDGVPKIETVEDFNRWHLFELAIVKLSRYAVNYQAGGHEDSLDDMIVYLAMVAMCDKEQGHRES